VVVGDNSSGFGGAGDYRLTLAKTGSAVTVTAGDQGGPLTNGALNSGTLTVGDLDVWTVAAGAGEAIVVRMGEVTPGSTLTPYLRIFNPAGAQVNFSYSATGAEVVVTSAQNVGGTFLVVVGDNSSGFGGAGDYRLTLAKTGSAVTVTPGDQGGPLPTGFSIGFIDVGDLDVWTLTPGAGASLIVTMEELVNGSPLTPSLRSNGPSWSVFAMPVSVGVIAGKSLSNTNVPV
jgi:hypothetical protein